MVYFHQGIPWKYGHKWCKHFPEDEKQKLVECRKKYKIFKNKTTSRRKSLMFFWQGTIKVF